MSVDRTLPTPEAEALLELTRELADGELRPRVRPAERAGEFPREVLRTLGRAGLLGLPYPERWAAAASRTRCTCRSSRSWPAAWLAVGLGRQRAHAGLLPDRGLRLATRSGTRCCRRCSAATCSGRTACPSRRPARTPPR